MAKILHVAYRALPDKAFYDLAAVGSVNIVCLDAFCKASLLRAATKTLCGWQELYVVLRDTALEHLPLARVAQGCLSPPLWDSDAIVCSLYTAVASSSHIPLIPHPRSIRQSVVRPSISRSVVHPLSLALPPPFSFRVYSMQIVEQKDAYHSLRAYLSEFSWQTYLSSRLQRLNPAVSTGGYDVCLINSYP
jgi:hypothetical protein